MAWNQSLFGLVNVYMGGGASLCFTSGFCSNLPTMRGIHVLAISKQLGILPVLPVSASFLNATVVQLSKHFYNKLAGVTEGGGVSFISPAPVTITLLRTAV